LNLHGFAYFKVFVITDPVEKRCLTIPFYNKLIDYFILRSQLFKSGIIHQTHEIAQVFPEFLY
jgi:hypothetical protein